MFGHMKKISILRLLALMGIFFIGCQHANALPPEVEADRQMLSARSAIDEKRWKDAIEALNAAEKTGVKKLPESFSYHFGVALNAIKDFTGGQDRINQYLNRYGTKARYYREALEQLNISEKGIKYQASIDSSWRKWTTSSTSIVFGRNAYISEEDACSRTINALKDMSPSAHNFGSCDCNGDMGGHPAYPEIRERQCKVRWEGNLILDNRSDDSDSYSSKTKSLILNSY